MSALESAIAVSGEAPMLDSLDFSLGPSNTAIVDRRQHVRAYPTSASSLSPSSTRTFRIRLGGDDFVVADSIRLQYTISETGGANPLVPLAGPWGAWSQVYLRSNGVELDNIPQYGRFHQQYGWNQLSQLEQFGEAAITGMAGSWNGVATALAPQSNYPAMGTIAKGSSYTVMHKLHLSLFSSGKMLPTRFAPLELEASLNPTVSDWLSTAANTSQSFSISNIQLIFDIAVTDAAVQESFYKALMSSRVLSIPVLNVYQVVQSIPAGSTTFSFAAVRAFSRLSHIWLTFRGTGPRSAEFLCPTTLTGNSGAAPALSDSVTASGVTTIQSPSVRLSVGPKYWPDPQPASSIPELFYMFQKAIPHVPNITRDNYLNNAFTIAFDLRRVPGDETSSISTRSGDLLSVFLQNLSPNVASECWLTMFSFGVCAIRESGVTLLT